MDHDVKSLQVLIEQEFKSLNAASHQMHAENKAAVLDMRSDVAEIKAQVTSTNGRLLKAEVAIAVLKFAVFTIGGALMLTAMQIVVAKWSSGL